MSKTETATEAFARGQEVRVRCDHCMWFAHEIEQCWFSPPTVTFDSRGHTSTDRPFVKPDAFCSEWLGEL